MGMPKIESGVGIRRAVHAGREAKYPWRQMKVGDSFVVDIDFPSLGASITRVERRLKIKLASRREGVGRRFYRIA